MNLSHQTSIPWKEMVSRMALSLSAQRKDDSQMEWINIFLAWAKHFFLIHRAFHNKSPCVMTKEELRQTSYYYYYYLYLININHSLFFVKIHIFYLINSSFEVKEFRSVSLSVCLSLSIYLYLSISLSEFVYLSF